MISNGHHLVCAVKRRESLRAAQLRYLHSEKGRATQHRYAHSEKGMATRKRDADDAYSKLRRQLWAMTRVDIRF
jgi:hypothetical protein